ncbi:putative 5xTM membrane YitT family protein [Shimia isoporae]|uniref:Putative 5xTM membrane YitT family protein n=1 Tax=Shimia isoporae TaxID=647720 RepID=A0A4R1NW91_9RHOB|nr:YitT family protein [Shimia isoporae]TCL09402.1 putative 5xTM membrane YitT family protein [Shimia isoporae]
MVSFLESPTAEEHSLFDDMQGLLVGTLLVAISVQFLQAANLFTGQIAGLALVGTKSMDLSFGTLFFALNLPFYAIAYFRMGLEFTLKTFAAVGLLTLWSFLLPQVMTFADLHIAAAAVSAGVTAGAGLIVLFRHNATLGGVGIVAVWLQDAYSIKAGWVQLGFDVMVFGLAVSFFPIEAVIYSLLGAAIINIMIATNHRRDRYIAR